MTSGMKWVNIRHYIINISINIKDQVRWIWTAVMLVVMSHLTFFLLVSAPTPSSSSKIFSMFKVGEWRNLKQLFLSVTYSELNGERVWHLFVHIPQLYIHELPRKYSREKILHPQSIHEKKCWTHEIPPKKKFLDPRHTHEKNLWTHEIPTRKKISNPQNTHEKKIQTHEIPMRKMLGPTF